MATGSSYQRITLQGLLGTGLVCLSILAPGLSTVAQENVEPMPGGTHGLTLIQTNDLHPNSTNFLADTNEMVQVGDLDTNHFHLADPKTEPPQTNVVPSTNALSPVYGQGSITRISHTNTSAETNLSLPSQNSGATNSGVRETNAASESNLERPTRTDTPPTLLRGREYTSFRIITERNIFNQNRSPGRPYFTRRESRPSARVESFALVGTMCYENGIFAFFDGTSSEYRKTVKPSEEIAGFKVAEVGYNRVKLIFQTNQIELPVGMQMRREDFGEWSLSARTESFASSSSSPGPDFRSGFSERRDDRRDFRQSPSSFSSTRNENTTTTSAASQPTTSTPSTDSAGGGSASEILKKLMERREQELNK